MECQPPDFGFDNFLVFDDEENDDGEAGGISKGWKYILDSLHKDRYQRVQNYVKFIRDIQQKRENASLPKAMRQISTIGKGQYKTHAEKKEHVRKIKEEMRNKNKERSNHSMSKEQIKYAEMGMELEDLNSIVSHENSFLKHLKKLAKQIDAEYEEEMGSRRASMVMKRRQSISKSPSPSHSPDNSPLTRGSIGNRSKMNNFKKLDMKASNYSSLSPKNGKNNNSKILEQEQLSQQMKQVLKPILPKKKAIFKEYTQSRQQIDLASDGMMKLNMSNNKFVPLTSTASRRGGSMLLTENQV